MAVAHFRDNLEEVGAIHIAQFSKRVAPGMKAFRLHKDVWRCGPRSNFMCAMCLTVRRGTDLCGVCCLIIPWSFAEFTYALQQLAMSHHLLEHGANMDPEKVQQLDNTCAWPPTWLCPIPSLHGLSL